jgi:hypothetical protein
MYEPSFKMFDDEFAMLISSKIMDLIDETYELIRQHEVCDIATPYGFRVLYSYQLDVIAERDILDILLTHPSK